MRTLLRSFIGLATGTLAFGLLALLVLGGLKQSAKPVLIVVSSSDLLDQYFGREMMDNTALRTTTFEKLWHAALGDEGRRRRLIGWACDLPPDGFAGDAMKYETIQPDANQILDSILAGLPTPRAFRQRIPAVTREHYADRQALLQRQVKYRHEYTQAQMDEELMTLRTEMGVPEEFYIRLRVGFEDPMGEMMMYTNDWGVVHTLELPLNRGLSSAIGADSCIKTKSNMTTERAVAWWDKFIQELKETTGRVGKSKYLKMKFVFEAEYDYDRLSLRNWIKRSTFYSAVLYWSCIIGGVIGFVTAWRHLLIRLLRLFRSLLVGASRSANRTSKAIDNAAENWNSPRDPE